MSRGKYIVIDGIAGVGKSTIAGMVAHELQAAQLPVKLVQAPGDLSDLTVQTIERLIEDKRYPMSTQTEVLLYNAARSRSLESIRADIESGVTCIVDHSYLATLVSEYYGRGNIPDYAVATEIIQFAVGGLQPDLLLVLDAPVSVVKDRLPADRISKLDESYLERVRAGYLWEAKQRNLPVAYATETIDIIFKQVWAQVAKTLSVREDVRDDSAKSVAEVLAAKPTPSPKPAAEPQAVLEQSAGPDQTPPTQPAAQPHAQAHKESGIPLTISNLLAAKLEWHHGIVYNEVPPGQLTFDKKDTDGHYRYYIPPTIKGKVRSQYIRTMNQLFDTYAQAVAALTVYMETTSSVPKPTQDNKWHDRMQAKARAILRPILPVAATTSIELQASTDTLGQLCISLEDDTLVEAHAAGVHVLETMRIYEPSFMQDHSAVERDVNLTEDTIKNLADRFLPLSHAAESDRVTLTGFIPRNELDLVADMLYAHSDLPLSTLRSEAMSWPYQRKLDICKAYLQTAHPYENVLRNLRYNFDIVSDFRTLRNLQRRHTFRDITHQVLSPRQGYSTPSIVEAAGLSDTVDDCFDLSLQLYSALQNGDHLQEAQYATLLGHKVRWSVSCNAEELFAAASSAAPIVSLVQEMQDKVAEVHPLVAETIAALPSKPAKHGTLSMQNS
jgi:thymidylate kinase